METNIKKRAFTSMLWKIIERFSTQGVSFFVSIILARLLLPKDYGTVALTAVFINISNVFVQCGLGTALIQNKDVKNEDYSLVLYFSWIISAILFVGLFVLAPFIGEFYHDNHVVNIIRVLGGTLFITSVNSVEHAYISRNLQFKKLFFSTLIGTIFSAVIGISLAYLNFGVWALVVQQIVALSCDTICLWLMIDIRLVRSFNIQRLKVLMKFGINLLISNLIETIYNNSYNLVIGKFYNSTMLGLYNKGYQFPNLIVTNVNSPIQSVLMPVLSKSQEDRKHLKSMIRRSVSISSFLIFPAMMGLAGIAEPLIKLTLTEKWIECVPFLQISCLTLAFWPIHIANLQAINAVGRSDIYLKLQIIKKIMGIGVLIFTIPLGIMGMAWGQAIVSISSLGINAYPNKKIIGYSIKKQLIDTIPYFLLSLIMGIAISYISLTSNLLTIILQIVVGVLIYLILSYIFKVDALMYIIETGKKFLESNKGR
ncbi:MAG: lipopolysaccharide biosynthesis protein [Blautia sp.]